MIRDPSDGSVREAAKPETEKPAARLSPMMSGLRLCRMDADRAEQLKLSREWLANYHEERCQRISQTTGDVSE